MAASDTHYNGTSNLLNFAEIPTILNQEEGGMMPPPGSEMAPTSPVEQPAPEQQAQSEQQPRPEQPEQQQPARQQPEQQVQPDEQPQPEQQVQPEQRPQPERPEQPEQRPQPMRPEQPEQRPQPTRPEQRPQPTRPTQPEQRPQPTRPTRPEQRPQPTRPAQPLPPSPGITVIPIPVPQSGTAGATEGGFTISPTLSPQYYGQVRFLNASANTFPVNISIDNYNYVVDSQFGTISSYDWVTDGFHTVTVRRSTGMRSVLLQQTFPFVAGEKVTMVLTDSAAGDLEMVRVVDTGCSNLPSNTCCYRFANMSYSGSNFDLMIFGGETVFRNISFQNVSSYKQAVAGTYQFYVVNANTATFIRELPIIVIGSGNIQSSVRTPLVSFQATLTAGQNFTSYVIGNTWSDNYLQVMTVQD